MDHVIALRQISVTALFYLENRGQIHPRGMRACFYMFFPPLGLPYVNWASQDCCLFYLRSSLWSSDLLCSLFAGFTLPCLLATAILDSYFLFYLPNTPNLNHHLHLYVTNSHSLCDDFPTNFEPKLGQP